MSALTLFRAARRVAGLSPQPEYPNLEALLEVEASKPHNVFRILSWVFPPLLGVVGAIFIPVAHAFGNSALLVTAACWLAAIGSWFVFDHKDKAIPPSTQRVRKHSELLWGRYQRLTSLVGVEPALSPSVGKMLDEAAGIYLKHNSQVKSDQSNAIDRSRANAVLALEEAMARMLELGMPETVHAQDIELATGWAMPLLDEMRETDRAIEQSSRSRLAVIAPPVDDPLLGLRNARLELQNVGDAVGELELPQSH